MRFWAGVTDNTWFRFLSTATGIDEVNFWHPSGRAPFNSLPEGTPFLFKLKAPYHHIAGGGYFVRFESLPLPLAWEAFGEKNGAATYHDLLRMIGPLRRDDGRTPEIGCSILAQPFFFRQSDWIDVSGTFAPNIVSGKSYDSQSDGALWQQVDARLQSVGGGLAQVGERRVEFGAPVLTRPRRGQGAFRATVTNAYQRQCAITGEHTLPVLEAAHIKPVAEGGVHNTYNGLLLRSDFHKLFDLGLVTVTPEHVVVVSDRIKAEWFNGKAYSRLHGQRLASLPTQVDDQPSSDLLRWHNDHRFERVA